MSLLLSLNVGSNEPNLAKNNRTGITKRPVDRADVRRPGPKRTGEGSGLVDDFIGDMKNHGGDDQAVYAYAREDLDRWAGLLDRELANGLFGENLTTLGIDPNEALLGERWRIGDVELVVTCPRIPCSTFGARMGLRGWVKRFAADGRPGAYFSIATEGTLVQGDPIEVVHRPDHGVTISRCFRAMTTERGLMPELAEVGDDLIGELRDDLAAHLRRVGTP